MAQPKIDEDNDVSMSTNTVTNTNNNDNTNPPSNTSDPNPTTPTNQTSEPRDMTENKESKEEKIESPIVKYEMHPLELVQSAMSDFMNEMSAADIKASHLYQTHIQQQQALMNQFVADSLCLMHQFNANVDPIRKVLAKLKQPLQDVLLNRFISVPCESLDEFTKKRPQSHYNQTWGTRPLTHQYNKKNAQSENPHLQYMNLGAVITSLKQSIQLQTNNDNKNAKNTQSSKSENDETDSLMQDKDNTNENITNETNPITLPMCDENELYNAAVLDFLSNANNITASQQDLVLKFFNTARAEQQRIEIKQQQRLAKLQREQQQKEQRQCGAQTLLSVLPWLTLEQAMIIMEMKADIIEQATDYAMNSDPTDLFMAVNEWKQKHPYTTDTDIAMNDNNGNSNSHLSPKSPAYRSDINPRVMNRSQTTGDTKAVTFRCTAVTDDGQITLQALLDRNSIPLDPIEAKLLFMSVADLMNCSGVRIENEQSIIQAQNQRVLSIVFQVVQQQSQDDLTYLANQFGMQNTLKNWRQPNYNRQQTEFVPIQFQPRCRDLEYELEFEDKTPPNNSCLKSVKHRMDGPVLFRGIYDDGKRIGVFGDAVNQPIDIYTEVIDDVTHNIVCIIFENDLRDNVVVDVKNISFTEQTLQDVISDSEKDFTKEDMAGNKISYRIIVKDKKIIGVLTKFGNEIKEMAYIEHSWMTEGELVRIPSRNMLGIIKCVPTGLIVTNNPYSNIERKQIKYQRNVNSRIVRKHCADLDGFIDIDIVREGVGNWRDLDNPLCQSFAVTDVERSNDSDIAEFISFKQMNHTSVTDEIKSLVSVIESAFVVIKDKSNGANKSDLLGKCIGNVKTLQELLSSYKNRKSVLSDEETKFAKGVSDNLSRYNREIRALRFEVKMHGSNQ